MNNLTNSTKRTWIADATDVEKYDDYYQYFEEKYLSEPTDESYDDYDENDAVDDYDDDGKPIYWYELHKDELPRVASVIKKYREIYTDEVMQRMFTKNDIDRLNDYMSTHDVDEKHLKMVFASCKGWIRSQKSYERGRPSRDLFIQDICHNQPAILEELCNLSGCHKE